MTYYGFPAVFLAIAALSIVSASVRRDWRSLIRAIVFTGPAAAAWLAYFRYEASLPLTTNIRLDVPFLWMGLLAVSLPAQLYVGVLLVEMVLGVGLFALQVGRSVESDPKRPPE